MFGLKRLKEEKERLLQEIEELKKETRLQEDKLHIKEREVRSKEAEIGKYQRIISYTELGGNYEYNNDTLDDLTLTLQDLRADIAMFLGDMFLVVNNVEYTVDGSIRKGQAFQKAYLENLIIGLIAYMNNKQKAITVSNYRKTVEGFYKTYEKYNKKAAIIGARIERRFIELKVEETKLMLDIKLAKEKERKQVAEQKRRIKEQQKILEEAEKERKALEAERKAMDTAFGKALTEEERLEIKVKIADIDKRIADVDYRCTHQQSGWLYVISSPCLEGMCKIGCTRRSSPTIRVKELSSSSLPMPFHAHGFVFSDDCFELESKVHKYFDAYRINQDREFFKVEPKTVLEVLKNKFNCDIHFEQEEE